jgi:multidrug resistance efflux pump
MHLTKGGRANDQKARLMLGTWRKETSWRITMLKGNELGEAGGTIELERIPHAAMIDPDGGRLINLKQEGAIERKQREADREAEVAARRKKRHAEEAEQKAAAKAEAAKAEEEAKAKAAATATQGALPLIDASDPRRSP